MYGYATDSRTFTASLVTLFSDVQPEEFIAACRRLIQKKRLDIRYEGNSDEAAVFAGKLGSMSLGAPLANTWMTLAIAALAANAIWTMRLNGSIVPIDRPLI